MQIVVDQLWDGRPAEAGEAVALQLSPRSEALRIELDAPFHGDPAPPGPPGPCEGLWEFEVVELFLAGAADRYLEVELGPHGHHLVLELDGPRHAVRRGLPLDYRARLLGARWSGVAAVPWTYLPEGPLALNAYAIHGTGPGRRHLAWAPVPGERPDFHQLDRFRPVDLARPARPLS